MNKHRTHAADGTPYTLKADYPTTYCGSAITLPAGAAVIFVEGNGGGFAIASESLLIELTGNTHDPVYRYAWVPAERVNGAEPPESWPKVRPERVNPVDPTEEEAGRIGGGTANRYLATLLEAAEERAKTGQRLNALDLAALSEAASRIEENSDNDDSGDYYGPDGPPVDLLADDDADEVEADSFSINEPPTTARPGQIVNLTRPYLIHGTDWRTHTGRSVMESGFYWITDAGAACGPFLDALDATKARDAGQTPEQYAAATTGAADHV